MPISRVAVLPPVRTNPDAGPASTVVRFPADWDNLPKVRGGTTVRFELPEDQVARAVKGDASKGWTGTFCYSINGSPPVRVKFGVNGPDGWQRSHPVEVALPKTAENMTFWLELQGDGGKSYYSNFGKNFTFDIAPHNPAMPPPGYNPPPNTLISDRWGNITGSRDLEPPTPVVLDPQPISDRWGHVLGTESEGKIDWK
jgi:hypothetical protein